jgi:L-malate glycosyltransferase
MTEAPEKLPYEILLATGYRVAPSIVERLIYIRERLFSRQIGRHRWSPLNGVLMGDRTRPDHPKLPAILIGMHWFAVGGAETLARDCIEWARDLGLRVFVVAERSRGVAPEGVTVLDWHDRPRSEWGGLVQGIVLQENIIAIHIHHCVPLYAALPVIRRELPWVRTYDSTHIVEHTDGGFVRISGVWSGHLDRTHVISRMLVNFYRDRFDRPVDLGRMIECRRAKPVRLQPRQTALRVAFVGRMAYQKRPVTALWAMVQLARWARKHGVDLWFDMVGEGPFLRYVHQIAEAKGLADRITFHRSGADVRAVLRGADILILPSANEGLALVAIEAIEEGVFPIATDVGAMGELLPRELLTPPAPAQTVRGIVRIVDRLWRDGAFLEKQALTLRENHETLVAEPSVKDVITGYYREAMGAK